MLTIQEAARHPHNVKRGSFAPTPGEEGVFEPTPAPHLSRTPGYLPRPQPIPGADTRTVLLSAGFSAAEVDGLCAAGHAIQESVAAKSRL